MKPQEDNIEFMQRLTDVQQDLLHFVQAALVAYPDDVWDVVQDTNYALISRSADYLPALSFRAWAFGFAKAKIAAYRLKKARERLVFDESMLDSYENSAFADETGASPYSQRLKSLWNCLKKLPQSQRRLIDLHYWKREPLTAIAKSEKKSESAVYVAVYRARQALAACMKRLCRLGSEPGAEDEAPLEPFAELLVRTLDTAKPDLSRTADFFRSLHGSPEAMALYAEQMSVHQLLNDLSGNGAVKTRRIFRPFAQAAGISAAAGLVLLLGGVWVARFATHSRPVSPVSPRQAAVEAPQLPAAQQVAQAPKPIPSPETPPPPVPPKPVPPETPPPAPRQITIPVAECVHPAVIPKQQAAARPQKEEQVMNTASLATNTLAAAVVATTVTTGAVRQASAQVTDLPVVSAVTFRQPFNSRVLEIGYTLSNGPGIVTLDITTNGVSIGDENLTHFIGAANRLVSNGTYTVQWNTKEAWPDHTNTQARAVVTAWCTNCPPDYMVLDLTKSGATYYTSAENLPNGGVTNEIYKTSRIVMRKMHASGVPWVMGATSKELGYSNNQIAQTVTLPENYYIGVFEVTQGQWYRVMDAAQAYPSAYRAFFKQYPGRPVEMVTYQDIRESANMANTADTAYQYPNAPHPDSFLGKLRTKTGIAVDLPSEAQWEYACRAGHGEGLWGDGSAILSVGEDTNLDRIARCRYTGGLYYDTNTAAWVSYNSTVSITAATAVVGSYLPNSWGLYDMHGNVWEWCLDWMTSKYIYPAGDGAVNTNSVSGQRVRKGGSFSASTTMCRAAFRDIPTPSARGDDMGFRLAAPEVAHLQ